MLRYFYILFIVSVLNAALLSCNGSDNLSTVSENHSTPHFTLNTAWRIDQSGSGRPIKPRICVDQEGNATAFWYVTGSAIFAARYDGSNGWSDQILVDESNNYGTMAVASDWEGNAFAIWSPEMGVAAVAHFEPGVGWRPIERFTVDYEDFLSESHVGMDRYGDGFAFFSTGHAHGAAYYYFRYSKASGWGERHQLGVSSGIERYGLDFFVAPNGNGTLAIGDPIDECIHVFRIFPDTSYVRLHQIDGASDRPTPEPRVAGDAQSNLFVIWRSQAVANGSTAYTPIHASHYLEESGWEPEELLSTTGRYDGSNLTNLPKIATDELGNAIGVWEDYDGTYSRVQASRFVSDTGWTPKTGLGDVLDGNETSPEIVLDPYGNAVAAWIQDTDSGLKIYANRFLVSEGWGEARSIDVDDAGDSSDLSLAVNNSGQVFAVWAHANGSNYSIYSNRLN